MVDTAIFFGWTRPVPGKERVAVELLGNVTSYLTRLVSEGRIDSFEPVLLEPHGGDLNGFILVRGDRDKLHQVRHTDDFVSMVMRGRVALENFGDIPARIGDGFIKAMDLYKKNI